MNWNRKISIQIAWRIRAFLRKSASSGWLITLLLLTLAACSNPEEHDKAGVVADVAYTCPMHPQVVQPDPGICPICAMDLVPFSRGDEASPEIMLSERQKLLGNIVSKPVGLGSIDNRVRLNAEITENKEEKEIVATRVPGRIERLYVKETGQRIQAGQPLYEIYSEELLTYQQEYLLALEQNLQLGTEEPRFAGFLESARRKLKLYGMTDAQIARLEAQKEPKASFTFVAPVSGIVTEIAATEGIYLPEGAKLYTIGRLDTLWVEAELYPEESNMVEIGEEVKVSVAGFEKSPVTGIVSFISPELRGTSQIVSMRVEIPNPAERFFPGMQASVWLESGEAEGVSVPTQAVIRDASGAHVWLQTSDSTYLARPVETGMEEPDRIALLSGVEPGERVVVNGAYLLYSEFVLKKGGDPLAGAVEPEGKALLDAHDPIAGPPVFAEEAFGPAYEVYLLLKNALVASDKEAAQEQAAVLAERLQAVEDAEKAQAYALRLAKAPTLEAQRETFFFLSNHMIELAQQKELVSGGMYVQFCPMANNDQGAFWLSNEEEILNPYYGESMLHCGEVSEVLE
ncbi:efflux RND transporter periplasmic adaptor subunit [Nafulsella turpanensis]|uniref:efflux RND transporter periplasmic adaptor subunit n=1 Tax=Nafulsella turpanensis TaxID=1265690 RepID=UPI00036F9449|nr:efflux RND transporter periplasmic adaptor subunit [Nafulsella turpanensis]